MVSKTLGCLAAVLTIALCKIGTAETIIDNTTIWGGQDVGTWGEPPQTATHGQTFTVGTDTRLDSFTFYIAHDSSHDPLTFAAYVMQWDPTGKHATGPILYQSGTLHSTDAGVTPVHASFSVQPLSVSTGGVELTTGQQYIAFFSASVVNAGDGRGWIGYSPGNNYSGGEFAFIGNGTNFAALSTSQWTTGFPETGGDLAFKMAFNVPEPSTVCLGLVGIGLVLRRRPQRRDR